MKNLYIVCRDMLILGLAALIIGVTAGALDAVFGGVLLSVTKFRQAHAAWLLPFLPLVGAGIVFCYIKFGKNTIKGMTLVFEAGHGIADKIPLRMVSFSAVSTWLTHLFGGSAGREGVAIQIGATIAHRFGRRLSIENCPKIMLVTGMAAGFAGLFQTPVAATFFALEVLAAGVLECGAIFPAMIAAFTASYTSHLLGLEKFTVPLSGEVHVDPQLLIKLVAVGILFGITGGVFSDALHFLKRLFSKWFTNPIVRIFVIGAGIGLFSLLIHMGRYSGLGTNLISESFSGGIYRYDFALKFLFTIVTLAAGFQGGEVTPLFSIGASLGAVLALAFNMPVSYVAALGYVCVFGSATNTLIAPMFIGAEIFGYEHMPSFFIACALAYSFNGNKSIYPLQKK